MRNLLRMKREERTLVRHKTKVKRRCVVESPLRIRKVGNKCVYPHEVSVWGDTIVFIISVRGIRRLSRRFAPPLPRLASSLDLVLSTTADGLAPPLKSLKCWAGSVGGVAGFQTEGGEFKSKSGRCDGLEEKRQGKLSSYIRGSGPCSPSPARSSPPS